ncbi:hypothetical protein [Pectinatus frisingensis]|uniref:hypothetical protein n=1 Tax=Pectinatus frisingensis TaxID=865 RepID=UPI003D800FB6
MKICRRALNRVQIYNENGDVRLCGWIHNDKIGSLLQDDLYTIYHSKRATDIINRHFDQDYSECNIDACGYLSMNAMNDILIDVSKVPKYPNELHLGFERVCNYACTSCGVPQSMEMGNKKKNEYNYKIIEGKLRPILPHIKTIGANGCGELFVSKHTLKLLAEWHPLAPKEDCHVILETNGSLFDEIHWKQIENLGQYDLSVHVTIMSFDESTYQILSGTTLPIGQIERNLYFIKQLREQGIINYLELATVVQERNFRTMPEFSKRCIEEFGADYVRLRPYECYGCKPLEIEWFTDVRGKYHPYHEEYLEVMKNPIFHHPRIHDLSGGMPSKTGELPQKRFMNKINIVGNMLLDDNLEKKCIENTNGRPIIVYGLSYSGKKVIKILHKYNLIAGILDRWPKVKFYDNIPVVNPECDAMDKNKSYNICIALSDDVEEIKKFLHHHAYTGNIISIRDFLDKGM